MSETCRGGNDHKHDPSLEMTLLEQASKRYQNLWKYYSSRVQPVTWILEKKKLQKSFKEQKDLDRDQ